MPSLNQPRILDNALQFGEFRPASLAEPMQHKPCAFLLDADFLGDLHRRDALAGGDKQVHGIEPLMQGDMRPLEDRTSTDREIKLALIAAMKASLAGRDTVLTGTSWAGYSLRPETTLKVNAGRLLIREHLEQFEGTDGRSTHGPPCGNKPLPLHPLLRNEGKFRAQLHAVASARAGGTGSPK